MSSFTPHANLRLIEPRGYLDFLSLQRYAALIITDSGGVQEESTYLGVPCLTARPNTERPVTITHGTNRLVASETAAIFAAARDKLATPPPPGFTPPELWEGHTAARIAALLV